MNSKKRLLCLFLIFVVVLGVIGLAGLLREETPQKLSELSAEKLFAFFADRDITFPEGIPQDINAFVAYIEKHPDGNPDGTETLAGWREIIDVLDEARNAVNEYYGINIEK